MKRIWNKIYIIIGCVLLTLAIIYMSITCYGASISGDEYFSIGFANNTKDFLFLSQGAIERYGTDGWVDGEFLHDWLSVQPGEQFSILQIHRNVRDDVHPPLYFMLLNIISSFFVNQVTLFPGYLINVVSGMAICVFLFLLSRKIFINKWLAFVPSVLWLSSNAAGITMTYLRMYAPLCALCLICIYLHICFLERTKPAQWIYICLGILTTIGTLTHYYFYIMQFVVFFITLIILIYRKRIKNLVLYGISLLIGEVMSLLAYPYVIRHLLFSERGTQVQENLTNSNLEYYSEFFKQFLHTFNEYVYNNRFSSLLIGVLLVTVIAVTFDILGKRFGKSAYVKDNFFQEYGFINFVIVAIAALGYFAILFKISYSSRWLYISPVFALLDLLTVGIFAWLLSRSCNKYYAIIIFVVSLVFLVKFDFNRVTESIYEHRNTAIHHNEIVSYSNNCDVLFFYEEWNNLYDNQILELMNFNQINAIDIKEIDKVDYDKLLASRKEKDNDIAVYLPNSIKNNNTMIEKIVDKLHGRKYELISKDDHLIYYIDM